MCLIIKCILINTRKKNNFRFAIILFIPRVLYKHTNSELLFRLYISTLVPMVEKPETVYFKGLRVIRHDTESRCFVTALADWFSWDEDDDEVRIKVLKVLTA